LGGLGGNGVDDGKGRTGFRTTNWTLIDAVRAEGPIADDARQRLAERYWPPVHAYLRSRGLGESDAADVAQSFFSEVILGRRLFEVADASRGRLRSLILAALKNHLIDRRRRDDATTARRNGTVSLEDRTVGVGGVPAAAVDPERIFDLEWAQSVLGEALDRCRRHLVAHQRERHWRAFERCVLQPAITGNRAPATRELAAELGFDSAAQLVASNQTVRLRVRMHLQEVAGETTDDPQEQREEYRHLVALLTPQ